MKKVYTDAEVTALLVREWEAEKAARRRKRRRRTDRKRRAAKSNPPDVNPTPKGVDQ